MGAASDRAAADLVALYEEAQTRIAVIVTGALDRGATGTAVYYKRQAAAVQAILDELAARTPAAVGAATSVAYNQPLKAIQRLYAPMVGYGGIHQGAVDLLAQNARERLSAATQLVGRRAEDALRQAGLKAVAQGIATGETVQGVAEVLSDALIRDAILDVTTGFIDAGGRRWTIENYARMVARTTTREAQSAATANRLNEIGNDLVTISDHGTESAICQPYEGETFSLTGQTPGYPVLDELPPFHPNCEHVLTPAAVTFDEWERELLAA